RAEELNLGEGTVGATTPVAAPTPPGGEMSNDHQSHRKAGQVGSGRPSGARRLGAGFLAALLAVSISLIVIPPGVAVAAVEGFEPRSGTISIERGSTVDVTVTMS